MATRTKTIQLRTSPAGGWVDHTQEVNNANPLCSLCGAVLWAMGKTVYCNAVHNHA